MVTCGAGRPGGIQVGSRTALCAVRSAALASRAMADVRPILPLENPVDADVEVVGSKSYTNRALVIAALARGESLLTGALFSDDTRYMGDALRAMGATVEADEDAHTIAVGGVDGHVPGEEARCFVGNAGTAARFLPVVMALGQGTYEL